MKNQFSSGRAVFLLLFLTLLNVLNFVDRQLLVSFGPAIKRDLELTNTQFALLTGLVFVMFYTGVGLVMGMIADRWNRPRLIAGGLILWSLLTAASGRAQNFVQLGAARLMIGVGEASLTPASLSMLSDSYPPKRRAFVAGFYYAGIPIGVGLSLIIAGTLGPRIGWRYCFYLLGGIGVAMSFALLAVKDPARGAMETVPAAPADGPAEQHGFVEMIAVLLRALRASPALVLTIIGGSIVQFGVAASAFTQIWLVHERGYEEAQAAIIFGYIFLVGGLVGNFLGGGLGDWLHARRPGGRLLALAMMQIFLLPFTLSFRFLPPNEPLFYVCGFMGSVSIMVFFGPVFSSVQDLAPLKIRSTVVAFLIVCINFLGVAPGALAAGMLSDAFGKRDWAQPITWGVFFVEACAIFSIPIFFMASRRYAGDLERLESELAGERPAESTN